MRYCGVPHNVAASLTMQAGFSEKNNLTCGYTQLSRIRATCVLHSIAARRCRRRGRGAGAKKSEGHCKFLLAMVYARGHPAAEDFDDKRLPCKRQVFAGVIAQHCGMVRAGTLADYAFG